MNDQDTQTHDVRIAVEFSHIILTFTCRHSLVFVSRNPRAPQIMLWQNHATDCPYCSTATRNSRPHHG